MGNGITVHQKKIGSHGMVDQPVVLRPSTVKHVEVTTHMDLSVLSCGVRGWRETMEDAVVVKIIGDVIAVGVFDGHGGKAAALWCARNLLNVVTGTDAWKAHQLETALSEGFVLADAEMRKQKVDAGCTAVVALIEAGRIVIANAGDSRAIIGRAGQAEALTYDHKPDNPIERKRITEHEGTVMKVGGTCRVLTETTKAMLAVSRTLGDFEFKVEGGDPAQQVVTCVPDVVTVTRTPQDDFLVLACDGIWDVMSNQDVVTFLGRVAPPENTSLHHSSHHGSQHGSQHDSRHNGAADGETKEHNTFPGLRRASWMPSIGLPSASQHSMRGVVGALLNACLKRGSKDNMTCMVVDLRGIDPNGFLRLEANPPLVGVKAEAEGDVAPHSGVPV